jgi:hypothetical protein
VRKIDLGGKRSDFWVSVVFIQVLKRTTGNLRTTVRMGRGLELESNDQEQDILMLHSV